ncbi:hypothetical protein Y032_0901g2952 [Ancylostoma ceylanicum]|uniref:EF-hand domain-containing protein n=2 Tax=Ancylostoma ceylanicum TaxID=53326 RepID=A0A016WBJ3_9BILA|nr:hypothetical protein Y032_0901g2952 [Ancylostoma ceylanicum]
MSVVASMLTVSLVVSLLLSDNVGASSRHFGKEEAHDQEHILTHLKDKIEAGNLTESQQRFHYFSLNDLNKDNKLDGNEIGKALWHSHGDQQAPIMTDDEIANVVDSVLKDMDLDGDGFIDYTEYATKML